LRRNRTGLLGITLLLGLIGGLSLFATAGARRTQSAYPRFLRSTNPSTMVVDVGGLDDGGAALAAIAKLPQVTQARAYAGFYVAPWTANGPDLSQNFEAIGSLDGRFFDQDQFTPLSGRAPDPDRADEVAVNEESARLYGYHVGQKIDFGTVSREDVEGGDGSGDSDAGPTQPRLLTHATIVGVGVFIEEVLQDDTDRSALVLFTPAYVRQAAAFELYAWQGLVLRNGDADVPAVEHAVVDMSGEGPQIFRVTSIDTYHAEQAIRPESLALAAFGIIAAVACLVLVGQALARHVRGQRDAHDVARSLGADRATLAFAASLGPAAAIVIGAVLAIIVAAVASPAMPIGRVRRVEVDRGFDVDSTVLGLGAIVFVVGLSLVLALVAWRETPRRARGRRPVATTSRFAHVIDVAGVSPPMAVGARFSIGSADRSIVRSVIASAAVAAGALVAALTFGTSMHQLISHPRLYGWDWDVALVDGGGYGNTNPTQTQPVLAADADIESWSGAFFGAEQLNGTEVSLLGMDASSEVTPPIESGRMVRERGEIVLGTATLAQLHVHVGDTVSSSSGPLHVVGSATFPTIGVVHGNHTSLGVGGLVVTDQVPGYDRNIAGSAQDAGSAVQTPAGEYGPNVLFVKYRAGSDKHAATDRLTAEVGKIADSQGIAVTPVQRPAEIVNADSISGASTWLAAAIAAAGVASFALALAAVVRRRRRDLALLKALGFTRRQVSATVSWHASIVVLMGLVIGVPAGLLIGRLTWKLFADQLDVVAEPAVSVIGVAVIVVGSLLATNAFGALMSRQARKVSTALALRDE
jgi:hypothetical protein